jgi:hypothetical protein
MALRSFLYLLGASLTIAGCFFPWSCRQVDDVSWYCSSAIVLRYSVENAGIGRLELHDSVRGYGFIILFLTALIVFFAFAAPQFTRRPKVVAILSSAALVLVSGYLFIAALAEQIRHSDAFGAFASVTLAIVCTGAILMLAAGAIDQRALRQPAMSDIP